jgi:hypothetical protein
MQSETKPDILILSIGRNILKDLSENTQLPFSNDSGLVSDISKELENIRSRYTHTIFIGGGGEGVFYPRLYIEGGTNMTGTICVQTSHSLSRSYLNHLVYVASF